MSDTVQDIGLYKIRVQHLCERIHTIVFPPSRKTKHYNNYCVIQKLTHIRIGLNEQEHTRTQTNEVDWYGVALKLAVEEHITYIICPTCARARASHHLLTSNSIYSTINDTNFDLRYVAFTHAAFTNYKAAKRKRGINICKTASKIASGQTIFLYH